MKGKSIIEVVVVFVLMKLFSIWFDSFLVGMDVQPGWRTFCFGLQAIVIPVVIIWMLNRRWSSYGFSVVNVRSIIHYGFIGTMLMMVVGMGFGFLKSQEIDPKGMPGSLLMSIVAVFVICLFMIITRKSRATNNNEHASRFPTVFKLVLLVTLAFCPVIVAIARSSNVYEIIAWDFYFLFMVGLGEEIKYRGYFQSRINEEYGRPWKLLGIPFGPGLIIVSLLFGLSHIAQFGSFNPFIGRYDIAPWMGLQAFFGSLFFGFIREKSDSIISSGIAHGVPNAFGQVIAMALK